MNSHPAGDSAPDSTQILMAPEAAGEMLAVEHNTEQYDRIDENQFQTVVQHPLATFAADVDTASYTNVRRFLNSGKMPPPDAVRIEEFVNYFSYDYGSPGDADPFSCEIELSSCPWNSSHRLAMIGIQGKRIESDERPPCNLVFLIDVSGSMNAADKLPLLKSGLKMLTRNLTENDRVAIVVYASATGLVLPSTPATQRNTILSKIEELSAGGSTNGGAGIELAYSVAEANFVRGGVNRVILATDGDFNVGVTNRGDLTRLIEQKAKNGVFLTVLGFGSGNLKDATMEQLADRGNGNYGYIDSIHEARRVLVEQVGGTLVTIAKDVKFQVEFNPRHVGAYRLIGYENRMLAAEDFNDDQKDAGEIGAGHTVTALFELVPPSELSDVNRTDPLKYQTERTSASGGDSAELFTVKIRYKEPVRDSASRLISFAATDPDTGFAQASGDFRFASAVAAFGMILRRSAHRGDASYASVLEIGETARGRDSDGQRSEFLQLVKTAQSLDHDLIVSDQPARTPGD